MVRKEEVELDGEIMDNQVGDSYLNGGFAQTTPEREEYLKELKDLMWKYKLRRIDVALVPKQMED